METFGQIQRYMDVHMYLKIIYHSEGVKGDILFVQ